MNNFWLIPMDFRTCNYEQMKEEWDENKKIMWEASGKPTNKNGEWTVENTMAKSLKKGDVVYFYVTNLPSESNVKLSRIMLRGKIEDEPYPIEKNKVYRSLKETTMISGFSIGSISTLHKELLENNLFLSLKDLRKRDNNFQYPRGKNWPDKNSKKSFSQDLIKTLEESFKVGMRENDFEVLMNHFNKKCFFCGKDGNGHKTFVGRNGLDYFEYHHFILQCVAKKFPELQDIIDSPTNRLSLCSNCHNKFHYGRVEEVSRMIEIVLEDSEINKMLEEFDFQKNIGENKDIFEWFQEVYSVK